MMAAMVGTVVTVVMVVLVETAEMVVEKVVVVYLEVEEVLGRLDAEALGVVLGVVLVY